MDRLAGDLARYSPAYPWPERADELASAADIMRSWAADIIPTSAGAPA